jgi:hypothetical protein
MGVFVILPEVILLMVVSSEEVSNLSYSDSWSRFNSNQTDGQLSDHQ